MGPIIAFRMRSVLLAARRAEKIASDPANDSRWKQRVTVQRMIQVSSVQCTLRLHGPRVIASSSTYVLVRRNG